ncbi:MAG: hypothetical protein ACYS9Y_11230 [Planctomycetota bacterium]|jgi:hypothetical protein
MNPKNTMTLALVIIFICSFDFVYAENIDPYDANSQYAYGENVGWLNFEPNIAEPNVGATVTYEKLTGFIWAENIGWINLDPNDADPDTGISNDGNGNLSGFAWGENVGWINFNPNVPSDTNDYSVTIDSEGNFSGWAWGENIGWINFSLSEYYVKACVVTIDDLANFTLEWLNSGDIPANLDGIDDVDFIDFSIFAENWWDYCPDGWQLK